MRMHRRSSPKNSEPPPFLTLTRSPTPTPSPLLWTKDSRRRSAEPCSKVVQRPRPRGGDPGAALLRRGWTGRGRGSSPSREAGQDRLKGLCAEAVVQPGAPGSCGPGTLDPHPTPR